HPDATHLPALLSFVLYNGDAPWTAPTSLPDLFDLSADARRDFGDYLLTYRYLLDDLQATPTESIDARDLRPHARLSLVAMKHAGTPDMLQQLRLHFADISHLLHAPGGMASLREVVYYLWTLDDEVTPERLIEELEPVVGQEIEHPMRTVAQQLEQRGFDKGYDKGFDEGRDKGFDEGRDKGFDEGRDKGFDEGRDKGFDEGRRLLLVNLLEARFGPLPDSIRARVERADAASLERWGTQLLSASSLDDVFSAC
ncbi:Rpn family recombination-promoting nuclease/putative transposase, partial [Haliangium sp.]|uniref:Rpn family recombination-promoting nuclease/putative transposase n=1 Tax=Haliangium sp. TaxID=2663208 RepID=UPI003D09799E